MNSELIITMLLAALTALAMNRYSILPRVYYHYAKVKPFTCLTCLAFWWGAILTFFFTDAQWLLSIPVGLASAALTIIIIKLTE
jgi:hypothetical protein